MRFVAKTIVIGLLVSLIQVVAAANAGHTADSIPRPELERLYEEADVVAFVKIVSGDTEDYEDTVYKAAVIKGFKGTEEGKTIFFGQVFVRKNTIDAFLDNLKKK